MNQPAPASSATAVVTTTTTATALGRPRRLSHDTIGSSTKPSSAASASGISMSRPK